MGQGESDVRRHTRASSAGSTLGRGSSLGSILRVAPGRGASSDAEGLGAPWHAHTRFSAARRSLLALACLTALSLLALLLSAPPAPAAEVTARPLLFTFDGSDTTAGKFSFNIGHAADIDQATGNVYVIDKGKQVLDKFNPAGEAEDFAAIGASSLAPGLALGSLSDIAVDNSGGSGGPGEGEQGRIYVTGGVATVRDTVQAFTPAGESLWQVSGFDGAFGIEVDSEGHLWVTNNSASEVHEFDTTGAEPPDPEEPIGSFSTAPDRPGRLGLDASGEYAYVGFSFNGSGVAKWELEVVGGEVVGAEKVATIVSLRNKGIAVDQSSPTGHVFTLNVPESPELDSFSEFDSTGALLGTYDSAAALHEGQGIAHNAALDRVYVSDRTSNPVKVFGPEATGTVPDVAIEEATEEEIAKATLNGKVNPLGIPNSYYFEWKRDTHPEWAGATRTPAQSLPEEDAEFPVSLELTGLKGNTTYQARLVGVNTENDLRNVSGPTTFTTLTAPLPTVEELEVSGITTESAHITATIDPQEDETTWRVQSSTDPACTSGFTDKPLQTIPAGEPGSVAVESDLEGLLPAQSYCVRIAATNSGGTTTSGTEEFTTEITPPSQVQTAFAAPRTDTGARLNGRVNPEGVALTYRFEYSTDGGETWIALPDKEDTSGERVQIVVADELTGLDPDTTYRYRFLAENAAGEASPQGEEKTFTTRTTAEATLPERGIELVNNPDKGTQHVQTYYPLAMAPDGEKAVWTVIGGAPGGVSGALSAFLAKRTPSGWRSRVLQPPPAQQVGGGDFTYILRNATADFSRFVFGVAGTDALFPGGRTTIVRLDDDQNQEVLRALPEPPDFRGHITDDAAHVMQIREDRLEDIGAGTAEVVGLLPDGTPACRVIEFKMEAQRRPGYLIMAATDASRVYFTDKCGAAPTRLYVRNREAEETTLIDPGISNKNLEFIRATTDGASAYFATFSQLDPADENEHADVYRWDEEAAASTCLTCVVPDANLRSAGGEGRAIGDVMVSDDFSHVYFESKEQLVPGQGTPGHTNLYVLSGGTIRFVADFNQNAGALLLFATESATLSADGNVLVVYAQSSGHNPSLTADAVASQCLTPASNETRVGDCEEVYRYDDRDGSVECISCVRGGVTTRSVGAPPGGHVGSDFRMSRDGSTVAFRTAEALVRLDVNRNIDIYEWRGGSVRLITDGVSDFPKGQGGPQVKGMAADGTSILFQVTAPGLTGFERDGLANLYVARIGGGFPRPNPPAHCSGDSCQGPLQAAPTLRAPGSSTFSGRGNIGSAKRCGRRKVRRGRRCVSKRALARKACRKKRGVAKRRCIRRQMKRLNRKQGRKR